MKTDIEIAQSAVLCPMEEIAAKLNLKNEDILPYGRNKAKIDHRIVKNKKNEPDGKVILVTAISPTAAGEGKTTTSIGLADGFAKLGKNVVLALREPSLGPVFGVKGGAAGGGYAQVVPMEDINLHFTGDLHAITAANNLLAAMIDNHIFQGNALNIDVRRISWKRCMDMNDRQLRFLTCGLGGKTNGMPREDGFDISVASEIMAIFCLAKDLEDLKKRLGNIIIGYSFNGKAIKASEINAQGAMCALLKDAFDPNLVQTLEGTPAILHGGPFANIAHGCNSVIATRLASKLADYVITEAGFGADLGAEKFVDIKCRLSGVRPAACVVVATVRALKFHGGCLKDKLSEPSLEYLQKGIANLGRHIDNMQNIFNMPVVVAVNAFPTDTDEEQQFIMDYCAEKGVECRLSEVFAKGGNGGIDLAKAVIAAAEQKNELGFTYKNEESLKNKIEAVCKKIYRAKGVKFAPAAQRQLEEFENMGYGSLPVCIAKTQYSFSDNPKLLAAPENFDIQIREARLSAGAGFVVAITGAIMTMPGLPPVPAAENIDVDANGKISGLF